MTKTRFDEKTRGKFRRRLRELYPVQTAGEIAKTMTSEGFTAPGGRPLTAKVISNQAKIADLKKRSTAHHGVIPPKLRFQEAKDNEAVISMIVASGIPKRKKLKALAALL